MSAVPARQQHHRVLMRGYGGEAVGTEVELLGPAPGEGRSFVRTLGGDVAFSADDCALRAVDARWVECRLVEAKLREMLAGLAGGTEDPREKLARRAIAYGRRNGLKVWDESTSLSCQRGALQSLKTILREVRHRTGDGTLFVTGVNEEWVVTLWLGVLEEWGRGREMFRDPGERRPVLALLPAPADEPEEEDAPEPGQNRPIRRTWARLDDVRLSVRLMEAWIDEDEDEFLKCLTVLERQGR